MNQKTTAILASVLIIALASSAIIGVTYSWFDDKDEVGISFIPGKIDISTEITDVAAKNYTGSYMPINEGATLDSGATVSVSKVGNTYNIEFNGAAPGDSLKFKMTIKDDSTINAKWLVAASGDYDENIFKVSIKCNSQDCNIYTDFTDSSVTVDVEIIIDTSVSSIPPEQKICITAKATQSSNPAIS